MAKRKKSSINQVRSSLYLIAKLLGDIQAINSGKVGKRVGRRIVGKATGKGIGKLFK